ncbi:hypothetical protein ACHAXR_006015, partial [Thalassiosira sp. AJA248-18]
MQQQQALFPDQGSEETEDPGRAADVANDRYEPNTGHGATLVDAKNAFNELNRYLMLWNTHHRWNAGSRFAFNRYRHHNIVYVRSNPGEPPIIITSQEGVAQGDVFGGFLYGIGLMPLAEQMREKIPTVLQTWFADDMAGAGSAAHNAECLDFLMKNGPRYGYFPEPEKSWYICKGEDEADARAAFASFGINIQYTRGHRYLGGFI